MELKGKKALLVFAHPDDEVIFGWPILQDSSLEKEVLMCSSDADNPDRAWCSHRKNALIDICAEKKISLSIIDNDSDFYMLETRQNSLANFLVDIVDEINSKDFDYILTHNPYGEYGHCDHKILFDTIKERIDKPILYSDIRVKTNWPFSENVSSRMKDLYFKDKVGDFDLDLDFYKFCEKKYKDIGVWTWDFEPVKKCSLYKL